MERPGGSPRCEVRHLRSGSRAYWKEWKARRPSTRRRSVRGSESHAARMSAHSVSPPFAGTTCAVSMEACAETGRYELSVCHSKFPASVRFHS